MGRVLADRTVNVIDHIEHEPSCSLFQREKPKHLRRRQWRGQERDAAELVGGRTTPASGALGKDGDARNFHNWRVEAKQTVTGAYRLTQKIWHKLVDGALRNGEEPILHVRFTTERESVVVIRLDLFEALAGETFEPPPPHQSWLLEPTIERVVVGLDPTGVELRESDFKQLKELLDEHR